MKYYKKEIIVDDTLLDIMKYKMLSYRSLAKAIEMDHRALHRIMNNKMVTNEQTYLKIKEGIEKY